MKKAVQEMLAAGIIVPGKSDWNSSILLIPKPDDPTSPRVCLDHRGLNQALKGDTQELPLIDKLIDDATREGRVYSHIDYRNSFWQLLIREKDRHLTAFNALGGTWMFTRLSMGLSVAAQAFQRWMNELFTEEIFGQSTIRPDGTVEVTKKPVLFQYLDDGLIATPDAESHWLAIHTIMQKLVDNDVCLKESKCAWFRTSVKFLGHRISHGKREMDESKVEILSNFAVPRTKSSLRTFLGMATFYRSYVPGYAHLVLPLEEQVKSHSPQALVWPKLQLDAFQALKKAIVHATAMHTFDPTLPTVLDTDASNYAYGAVLHNEVDDGHGNKSLRPCLMFSAKFDATQRRWSTTRQEQHAIRIALDRFHYAVHGAKYPVRVRTDHMAATFVFTKRLEHPTHEETRLIKAVSQYRLVFEHVPGRYNQFSDWLSRAIHSPRELREVVTVWDCCSGIGTVARAIQRCADILDPNYTVRYVASDTCKRAQEATANTVSRVLAANPNLIHKSPKDIYFKKPRSGAKPPPMHDLVQIVEQWEEYPNSIPVVDVACFGPPCQPRSRAGKGLGSKDDRDLFSMVLRAIELLLRKNKDLLYFCECTLFHQKLQKELEHITKHFENLGGRCETHDLKYLVPSHRVRLLWSNIPCEPRVECIEDWKDWDACLDDADAPAAIAPCAMASANTFSERSKDGRPPAAWVLCHKTGKYRPMSMAERERIQGAYPGDCLLEGAGPRVHQQLLGNSFPVQLAVDMLRPALEAVVKRKSAQSAHLRVVAVDPESSDDEPAGGESALTNLELMPSMDHFVRHVRDLEPTQHYLTCKGLAEADGDHAEYCMRDGVLWKWVSKSSGIRALYIPDGENPAHRHVQQAAAHAAHACIDAGAHGGFARTAMWFDKMFFWPGAHKYLTQYVKSCPECQLFNTFQGRTAGDMLSLAVDAPAEYPGQSLAMDWVSGFAPAATGEDCVWVWVDRFTRRVLYIPMNLKLTDKHQLQNLFMTEVLPWFGRPKTIIADADTKVFTKKGLAPFSQFLKDRFDVKWVVAASKWHQTNGQAEAQVKNLALSLSKALGSASSANVPTVERQHRQWPIALKLLQVAYNNSVNTATKVAPNALWQGRTDSMPWFEATDDQDTDTLHEARRRSTHIETLWDTARAVMKAQQDAAAVKYNKQFKQKPPSYKKGDFVKVLDFRRRDPSSGVTYRLGKIRPKYVGPLRVTKVVRNNVFVDWSTSGVSRRIDKVNMAHVAPWFATDRSLFPDTALRPTSFADVPAPSAAASATPPGTTSSPRETPLAPRERTSAPTKRVRFQDPPASRAEPPAPTPGPHTTSPAASSAPQTLRRSGRTSRKPIRYEEDSSSRGPYS